MQSGMIIRTEEIRGKLPKDIIGEEQDVLKQLRVVTDEGVVVFTFKYHHMDYKNQRTGVPEQSWFDWIEDVEVTDERRKR